MNSREVFKLAMAHKQSKRLPIDIGGTSLTSMSPGCQKRLSEFLGIDRNLTAEEQYEKILEWAGTDFRNVGYIIQLPSKNSKEVSKTEFVDCWGIQRQFIDEQWQIVNAPLKNASVDDLKSYPWPDPVIDERLLESYRLRAKKLHEQGKYVVIAEHPYYGILELGMWLCGYDEFLIRLAIDQDFVKTFFEKITQLQLKIAQQYYTVLGPYIDLTTSGDDFGTQRAPMISPEMFDKLITPYFSERIRKTKELANCYYWHHSCGSVYDLMENLLACGIDILDPVQTSSAKMEPQRLKEGFGSKIVFWGAVDVQQFLPEAKTVDIEPHITELINTLGRDGGYVIAPAHNMQDDIPPENIAAWVDAMKKTFKNADLL
jgi:uroporphyrinogen decarboxylase